MDTMTQGEDKRSGLLFRGSDVALLLLRAMIGVVFIAHGSRKLFGAFGGGGLDAAAKAMDGDWTVVDCPSVAKKSRSGEPLTALCPITELATGGVVDCRPKRILSARLLAAPV